MIGEFTRDRRVVSAVAVALSALLGVVAFVVASPAQAAVSRNFTIRYQNNDHGDILLRGNTLLTCPASNNLCAGAVNRTNTGTNLNNNSFNMVFADVDGDSSTTSSSTAVVTLPTPSTVLWAGLYWSAYTTSGNGNTRIAPPAGTSKDHLKFKAPGDTSYRTITATTTDDGTSTGLPYSSFADVTSIVRAAGSGTYAGADIHAATGPDSYGAWSLVTVVKAASMPKRNLTVFDGFGTVQNQTGDTTIDIPLSGFETPPSGSVDVRLGTVAYEGDAGSTGDALQVVPPSGSSVGTTTLTDNQNPANNYFNSTISDGGSAVTGRNPDGNAFGFDADVYSSSVVLGNSATSATLRLTTGGETYFPAVATFVANIYAPDLTINQSGAVNDVNSDGRTGPGDTITYTVNVQNTGDDESDNTVLTSPIPAGTAYVPGSLKIAGSGQTDAADGDQAQVSGSNLVFRLGTGAGGSGGSGGVLLPNASQTYTYQVLLTGPFASAGDTVSASSSATYDNPGNVHFTSGSNVATNAVGQAISDLAVTHSVSPAVVQRGGTQAVTWTVRVHNNGPDRESAPVVTQTLPTGVTSVSSSGTCTGTTTLTCSLAPIASGDSATITFTADLPSGAPDPSSATAAASGAGTDPVSSNNSAVAAVGVNSPPSASSDTASLPGTTLSTDIDVLANDTDPDGDPIAIDTAGPAAHGTATIVNGKVRYTLTDAHFTGTDTFLYQVCDTRNGCSTATVSVTVAAHVIADLVAAQTVSPSTVQRSGTRVVTWTAVITNHGPDAEPSASLTEVLPAGATAISVTGATCSASSASSVTRTCPLGALAIGASTTITFTATLAANTPDPSVATATASGTTLDTDHNNNTADTGVVVNTPPVAKADNASLSRSVNSVVIDVVANDTDADGDPRTLTTVTDPGHGTATITAGKILYALTEKSFAGNDTFTYTVCDGRGGCDTTTITVAVANHGHAPVAKNDTVKTPSGTPIAISPLENDTDSDGDKLAIERIVTQPSHGSAVISGTRIVYTPADGYEGPDVMSYETCDPSDLCDRALISFTVTSLPPVANTDRGAVRPGGSVVVDVLSNDTDPQGRTLGSVKIIQQPKYGSAYVDSAGKIHYSAPAKGVPGGKVTIRYRTCNATGACAEGSVVLTVAGAAVSNSGGSGNGSGNGSGGGGGGPLAFTGANVGRLVLLAFMLMLLGTASLLASRRRARPALAWRSYNTPHRYQTQPPRR